MAARKRNVGVIELSIAVYAVFPNGQPMYAGYLQDADMAAVCPAHLTLGGDYRQVIAEVKAVLSDKGFTGKLRVTRPDAAAVRAEQTRIENSHEAELASREIEESARRTLR